MDVTILAIQAQILMWTGLLCLAAGLWLGIDPLTMSWRAAVAAVLAMWIGGKLLRIAAAALSEGMAAAEVAAAAQAAPAKPARTATRRP